MRLLNLLRGLCGARVFGTTERAKFRLAHRAQLPQKSFPLGKQTNEGGGVMIDVALTAPIFLAVLLTSTEFVRSYIEYGLIQHAVHRASRYASLGYSENGMTDVASVLYKINSLSGMDVSPNDFSICPVYESPCVTNRRGGSEEWIRIQAKIHLKSVFGGFNPTLTASAIVRNEPKWTGLTLPTGGGGGPTDDDGGGGGGGNGGGGHGGGRGKENSEQGY